MNAHHVVLLPMVAAALLLPAAAFSQTPAPKQRPGTASAPPQAKPTPQQKQSTTTKPPAKPPAKPATSDSATPAKVTPTKQPMLLGQYDGWGAYWAAPDGRKVCFAAARPNGTQTNKGRTPSYLFITSRPHDKIKDEVSAIVSFPLKSNADATAVVGKKQYTMSTQADGVWIKNQADEPKLIEDMRKGSDLVLKATTDRGLQSTDTFSLKGLAQALDRIARECK